MPSNHPTSLATTIEAPPLRPGSPSRAQAVRAWVGVAVWLALIALESSSIMSAQNTGSVLAFVLGSIFGPISPRQLLTIQLFVRKTGHFVGYAILSYLMFRAWRATWQRNGRLWERRWAILALLGTIAVAALDEWHQAGLASRTGALRDVVLDGLGAVFAQLMIVFALAPVKERHL